MEPLLPRLNVKDIEKGGPKPPPRNKMAVYKELFTPSSRLINGSTTLLPIPSGGGSRIHHASSGSGSGSSRQVSESDRTLSAFYGLPASTHWAPRHSVARRIVHKYEDASPTTKVDYVSSVIMSPDDVMLRIGQQNFWKIRRILVRQQRIFSIQVFELHRLVQKSLAGSSHHFIENSLRLQKRLHEVSNKDRTFGPIKIPPGGSYNLNAAYGTPDATQQGKGMVMGIPITMSYLDPCGFSSANHLPREDAVLKDMSSCLPCLSSHLKGGFWSSTIPGSNEADGQGSTGSSFVERASREVLPLFPLEPIAAQELESGVDSEKLTPAIDQSHAL